RGRGDRRPRLPRRRATRAAHRDPHRGPAVVDGQAAVAVAAVRAADGAHHARPLEAGASRVVVMAAIYLVRHGQASFGAADYDCLSPLGEKQAARLGAALKLRVPSLKAAWCGGMKRHRQTAEACLLAMEAMAV